MPAQLPRDLRTNVLAFGQTLRRAGLPVTVGEVMDAARALDAIDLLDRADDFPKDGPLLVITDGQCDRLRIRRDHAFLLPDGARLPFVPTGQVFRVK